MKKWFLAILSVLFGLTASATEVQFDWDIPTSTVDGRALPVSQIQGYRIYSGENLLVEVEGGQTDSSPYTELGYGNKCYSISTVDIYGQEGPKSEPVCLEIMPSLPSAPTLRVSF